MKNKILKWTLIALAPFAFVNCSETDSSTAVDPNVGLYTDVLTNVSNNVIVETYNQMNTKAIALKNAITTLKNTPNDTNLTAVKLAWQATRLPWEQSQGFLYGPDETESLTNLAIDSWPVDEVAVGNIISGGAPIAAATLETNNHARGFHTMEYLIWGLDGNKTAAQLTARELEYLVAAATDLQNSTQQLYDAWKPTGGNYVANFQNAGQSGSVYSAQKAALQEIAAGMIQIADELVTVKIEGPLNGNAGNANPEAEESRSSNNSKLDFTNNIKSIQNMYLGDYNSASGKGLTDIILLTNPTLDAEIKEMITAGITAIDAIPGPFSDAITNSRARVQEAQQAIGELKILLESEMLTHINSL